MFVIEQQKRAMVATHGSQRRVYNGCHHPDDWEEGWTAWDWISLCDTKPEADEKLKFWKELNDYSVSVGGRPCRYRIRETESV